MKFAALDEFLDGLEEEAEPVDVEYVEDPQVETHVPDRLEVFTMENVTNARARLVDHKGEDDNTRVEPGRGHAKHTYKGHSFKCGLAKASDILSENIGNIV